MKLCLQLVRKPALTPRRWSWIPIAALSCCLGKPCPAQQYTAVEREQAQVMLKDAADNVKKHYFDPLALGSDWDARVRTTREKVDQSDSINQALSHIAALLDSLNDSLALSASEADSVVAKMRLHNAVVLDLRGNPGGDEYSLRNLLGGMFDHKVKIGDAVASRSTRPIETETHRHAFTGKLVVLIDSQSGSAAEVFARVIQLEKRGLVMGDQSAGRVRAAQQYMNQTGLETRIVYGTAVTEAEIRMADGQSLEHQGVIPDKLILPTAEDIAGGRDPVLAAAAESLRWSMSPEEAGALFPYRWPKE